MPPAISDSEPGSDIELGNSPPPTKLTSREKKRPLTNKGQPVEDFEDAEEVNDDEGEDGEDGEEGEEEEDVYVVEKILSHMVNDGVPFFQVKWEGYEKKSDQTWEPEDNLRESASLILSEYLKSIGGREALFEQTALALKTKKRGRPSQGTPSASGKKSRRNGDYATDSDTPVSAKNVEWKPPAGSWEDHIAHIDACEDEVTNKLMVYLTWKNGQKTVHETKVVYQRCPQKMLQFYERHVRIIKAQEEEDVATPDLIDD